jgi:uncharacterized protein
LRFKEARVKETHSKKSVSRRHIVAKNFSQMELSNASANPSIHVQSQIERRTVLSGGLAAWMSAVLPSSVISNSAITSSALLAGCATAAALQAVPLLGFKGIPTGHTDQLVVPDGYTAQVLAPWGEAVGVEGNMPAWKADGSNSAADQAVQMGMHHDGMHFYALPAVNGKQRGLLVMNHEYADDGLLHTDGMATWSAEKVLKAQAAHGISVIEVELKGGKVGGKVGGNESAMWDMVHPSQYARRFTTNTPFAVSGPAAGHAMMKTAADPQGRTVLGTLNNCASGKTPWGTYLSGEENWAFYFDAGKNVDAHQKRWGLREKGFYRWPEFDARFDVTKNPNEPNRFGWVVEVDPMDPTSTPIKRTALGRAAHEGAWVAVTKDNRAVVYSGEDARFEYIYKFVSRDSIREAGNGLTKAQANRDLLDHGTLYVARFDADGSGRWLPLVAGQNGLTPANGFADQGEVVIKARQASDLLGGTKMDRPEWLAIDEASGEVFCTLTNNSERGAAGKPAADAANPLVNNVMGNVIRWKEGGVLSGAANGVQGVKGDFDATAFTWDHLVFAGDPANDRPAAKPRPVKVLGGKDASGKSATFEEKQDIFACPDGLALDKRGVLWIQTDAHASQMYKGELKNIGNNQMLACDRGTGEIRRFLTGPINCEITGCTWSDDGRTMFVNIQHPGESASDRSDPANPDKFSNWPSGVKGARPRSATVVIRRHDGGVIGL